MEVAGYPTTTMATPRLSNSRENALDDGCFNKISSDTQKHVLTQSWQD